MDEKIQALEQELYHEFSQESSGHDLYHLKRVYNLACTIQASENGDLYVIKHAALLHDIHRIIQKEQNKYCTPKDSLSKVEQLLRKVEVEDSKIPHILHCIEFHEEYSFSGNGITVTDIETLILQDADNLDAIGAIGIGRAFAYGGANGLPLWIPESELITDNYDETKHDPSTIHHFYHKLLKLEDNMNTKTGKRIAKQRHEVMERFVQTFIDEWEGRR